MGELELLEHKLIGVREELVESVMRLIAEDAPKNKFSIVTGKLLMIEEVQSQINVIKNARNPRGEGKTGA